MAPPLSIDQQRKLIKAKIKPGSIISFFCDFLITPKYKYCVIMHTDYEEELFLCFLVNSEIANFIKKNPDLYCCQLPLQQSEYPFFTKDKSYLNCAEIIDKLPVNNVIDHLIKVPDDYKGNLVEEDIQQIISIVQIAKTISSEEKNLIIASLTS